MKKIEGEKRFELVNFVSEILRYHPYKAHTKLTLADVREIVREKLAKQESEKFQAISKYSVLFGIFGDWMAKLKSMERQMEAGNNASGVEKMERMIAASRNYNQKGLDRFTRCIFEVWKNDVCLEGTASINKAKDLAFTHKGYIIRRDQDNDLYFLK